MQSWALGAGRELIVSRRSSAVGPVRPSSDASCPPRRVRTGGVLVVDVLTWVMQRRLVLAYRAERLRKDLAELDTEVVRLEVAEVVCGQFADAHRAGRADDPAMTKELERVATTPRRAGFCWSRTRGRHMDAGVPPADHLAILKAAAGIEGVVKAEDVAPALGKGVQPAQVVRTGATRREPCIMSSI